MIRLSDEVHGIPEEISNLMDRGRLIQSDTAVTNPKNKTLLNLSTRVQNLMNASPNNEELDDTVPSTEEE
tara:strand:+ start:129 stop:338 length:210 start_codon:yes stop_codon:yes gene_type:complete